MHEIPDIEVKVAILITTDKRNERTDISGKLIEKELRKAGIKVLKRETGRVRW